MNQPSPQPALTTGATTASVPRRGRGRRPAADVRADVLDAVGRLLLCDGLTSLTMERIAREAAVSKTTLHKWWPSLGALALDGYCHAVEDTLAFPDTGDIRADLTTQLREFVHLMTGTPAGRALLDLIGKAQSDPNLATQYRQHYSAQRRQLAVTRLRTAQREGHIRPTVDPESLIDQLWGAVYHRLLIPDQPVTPAFTDSLIANLFDGIAPAPTP